MTHRVRIEESFLKADGSGDLETVFYANFVAAETAGNKYQSP